MRDTLVRHLDDSMQRRIEALAQARHWSSNRVILHALHHGLRILATEACIDCDEEGSVASRIEGWDKGEAAAFDAAVHALVAAELEPKPAG